MTYNISGQAGFERILADVGPLADRMTGWSELTYFAASIAESAEAHERALAFYRRLQGGNKQQLPAETLAAKIKALETVLAKLNPNIMEDAVEKMHSAALDATKILNELFALKLDVPRIELISDEMRNAYWDGKAIHAPAAVKELPDIVYHEVAWPFIQKRWSFSYRGQEGALAQSYTDVLTSLIKQKKLGQTAQEADWTIAPGAIAWIAGNKAGMRDDRRPLVSLKAPGTAYNDELLGKDPQPAHFSKFVVVEADNGGIHINSGIPNKAFYEAAIRIGSEKAGKIWIESLTQFKTKTDIPQAAKIIHETAVRLYGKDSGEENAVQKAWNAVGLLEQRS